MNWNCSHSISLFPDFKKRFIAITMCIATYGGVMAFLSFMCHCLVCISLFLTWVQEDRHFVRNRDLYFATVMFFQRALHAMIAVSDQCEPYSWWLFDKPGPSHDSFITIPIMCEVGSLQRSNTTRVLDRFPRLCVHGLDSDVTTFSDRHAIKNYIKF